MISRPTTGPCAALLLVGLLLAGAPAAAVAQPKPGYSPSSTHIFPAGGQRGTTVRVRVGTECAPPETDFLLYGQGLKTGDAMVADWWSATSLTRRLPRSLGEPDPRRKPTEVPISYPREWAQEITIADDAPLGASRWRISCAQGGTATRPFLVGNLPEHIESESNSAPERAESLTLPVTLNGQIYGERDVDFFRVPLKQGQVLVCDVLASRIDSRLDPVVQWLDADGRLLDCQEARVGNDPILALKAPHDGDYLLRVSNITFHGNAACVYRITLTTQPVALYTFPSGGQAGTTGTFAFHTLTGQPGPPTLQRHQLTLPAAEGFFQPPGRLAPPLIVDGRENRTETEPNNSTEQAQAVPPTATLHGRLANADDVDRFAVTVRKGQRFTFHAAAYPPGSSTLPVLTLLDQQEKRLARAQAIQDVDREARIEWTAPADGRFVLEIRDLRFGSRGGDDFLYRLTLQPAAPDFALHAGADALNLTQGTDSAITLRVGRTGGFKGPIQLAVAGLPKHVTCTPSEIGAGATSVKLIFKAAAEAASQAYPLSITATAKIDGRQVTHRLDAKHKGLVAAGTGSRHFHLTVCHKPVFRMFCFEAYLYAHRGTIFPYVMTVERLDGFDEPITVQIGDRQNRDLDGIEMIPFVIPPGKSEGRLPIYLPETMHINIQSQSQLYSQAFAHFTDKHGRRQAVLVLAEKRNMLRTRPLVVKMFPVDEQVSGEPGAFVDCRLRLKRTTNFPGPMTVVLHDTGEVPGFLVKPTTMAAGATSATVKVRLPTGDAAKQPTTLTFRATGKMPDGTVTITESRIRYVPPGTAEK
ncbi:MAG: hypothetical protein CMJ65_13670 [Planctomycetaceae bacterium]|nr:hypothetical protein [Planctomycetaceae bacterium]